MKTRMNHLIHCVAACMLAASASTQAADATHLRCEYLENPLGIEASQPRLSWAIESNRRSDRQTAYQVLVASSEDLLKQDKGDLWDSGQADFDQSTQVEYRGKPLNSGAAAYWKVRVWVATGDKASRPMGKPSAWSQPAKWTMGLLKADDWKAQWISFRDTTALPDKPGELILPPARYYRKEFSAK